MSKTLLSAPHPSLIFRAPRRDRRQAIWLALPLLRGASLKLDHVIAAVSQALWFLQDFTTAATRQGCGLQLRPWRHGNLQMCASAIVRLNDSIAKRACTNRACTKRPCTTGADGSAGS